MDSLQYVILFGLMVFVALIFLIFVTKTYLWRKAYNNCEGFSDTKPARGGVGVPTYHASDNKFPIRCIDSLMKQTLIIVSDVSPRIPKITSLAKIPSGAIIGYSSKGSLYAFQVLCISSAVDHTRFMFREFSLKVFQEHGFNMGSIDVFVFTAQIDKDPLYNLLRAIPFRFVDYDTVDKAKLLHFFPTAELRQVELSNIVPEQKNTLFSRRILVLDILHNDRENKTCDDLKLAAYKRFSHLYKTTQLEHYKDNIEVEPPKIDAYMMINNKEQFKMMRISESINGIQLKPLDKVILHNQDKIDENDTFIVYKIDTNGFAYITNAYPILRHKGVLEPKTGVRLIPRIEAKHAVVGDRLYLVKNRLVCQVEKVKGDQFMCKQLPQDDLQHMYSCTSDPRFATEQLCISKTDITGEAKDSSHWDRPCVKDYECPFFKTNKMYENTRGGCNEGSCEMPLGVERIGFRKFKIDDTSYPICHGCDPSNMKDCCEKQLYRDVAFPYDLDQRYSHK